MPDSLALTVTVPADAWDACNRRVAYLETLLIGIADRHGLDPEWFDVERLAGLWGRQAAAQDNAPPEISAVVIPAWVLPLFRLMKGISDGDLAFAWELLPDYLPADMDLPDIETAAATLLAHGLV